jgi:hypothetical protein
VSTVADVEVFGRLLDRRAHARLAAMTGAPIPVTRRPLPGPSPLATPGTASQR